MLSVTSERIVTIGALLSDATRVALLTTLMDGRAYTGSELARHAGVAPSTASEHLTRLLTAGLVAVEPSGRHRYYRIAGVEAAELLESLGAVPVGDAPVQRASAPQGLALARTCYDHLAGELAVALYDHAIAASHLTVGEGSVLDLAPSGQSFFADLGVEEASTEHSDRPRARRCLDWTERRHHLGGRLGAALLAMMLANHWLTRGPRPRSIRITRSGQREIPQHFPGLAWKHLTPHQ